MKSYQFFTDNGRGGTMLCDDESLDDAVAELTRRFKGVVRVQIGDQSWTAPNHQPPSDIPATGPEAPDGASS